jgi:hypothetical protein
VPQAGQGEPLETAVQHAGDGFGTIHRRGGDPVDEGIDVVPGELGRAQLVLQRPPGVLLLVPPRLGVGEPGPDPLVDLPVLGLPDGSSPEVEQVAGSARGKTRPTTGARDRRACSVLHGLTILEDRRTRSRLRPTLLADCGAFGFDGEDAVHLG